MLSSEGRLSWKTRLRKQNGCGADVMASGGERRLVREAGGASCETHKDLLLAGSAGWVMLFLLILNQTGDLIADSVSMTPWVEDRSLNQLYSKNLPLTESLLSLGENWKSHSLKTQKDLQELLWESACFYKIQKRFVKWSKRKIRADTDAAWWPADVAASSLLLAC